MAVKALVGNGDLLMRDHGVMAGVSAIINAGVKKNFLNECEVTTNQVNTGLIFIEVVRDTVSPSEVFLIPVVITSVHTVDTSGNGWIIARIDETILDAEDANAGGTDLVVVEKVTSLPSANYVILATLSSGSITDARTYSELSEYIQKNPIFYDEDVAVSDAYAITVNGLIAYEDGQEFWFKANTANTGACTLNVNSLGAKAIKIRTDADLVTGDIEAGSMVGVRYDADNDWFQMLTPSSLAPSLVTKADQSDAEAGTDNDKYMTSLRTRQAIDFLRLMEGTAGEAIDGSTTPKVLARCGDTFKHIIAVHAAGVGIEGMQWDVSQFSQLAVGDDDSRYKRAQSFTVPDYGQIGTKIVAITMQAEKAASPTDNVKYEILTDNTDRPTTTVITNGTSNLVAGSTLPNGNSVPLRLDFGTSPDVQAYVGQKLWAAFRREGAAHATNYYRIGYESADNYPSHGRSDFTLSAGTWDAQNSQDIMLLVELELDFGNKLYLADADDLTKCQIAGVTKDDVSEDDPISYYPMNLPVDGFSGFEIGAEQFVDTTPGGLVESPGAASGRCVLPMGDAHDTDTVLLADRMKVFLTEIASIHMNEVGTAYNMDILVPTGIKPMIIDLEYSVDDGSGNDSHTIVTRWVRNFQKGGLIVSALDNNMAVQSVTTKIQIGEATASDDDSVVVQALHQNAITLRFRQTDDTINGIAPVKVTVYGH